MKFFKLLSAMILLMISTQAFAAEGSVLTTSNISQFPIALENVLNIQNKVFEGVQINGETGKRYELSATLAALREIDQNSLFGRLGSYEINKIALRIEVRARSNYFYTVAIEGLKKQRENEGFENYKVNSSSR